MDSIVQHKSKYSDHDNKYSHPPNTKSVTFFSLFYFRKPLNSKNN